MVLKKILCLAVVIYAVFALQLHYRSLISPPALPQTSQPPKQFRIQSRTPKNGSDAEVRQLIKEGKILMRANQLKGASAIFEQALKLDPQSFSGHFNLGHAMVELGRFTRAEKQFLTCTLINPHDNSARFAMASVYEYSGRFADAILVFKQILKSKQIDEEDRVRVEAGLARLEYFRTLGDANGQNYIDADETHKWKKTAMPVRISIWTDPELKSVKQVFNLAVVRSFEQWRQASGDRVSFVIVPEQRSADIVCKLVRVMRGARYDGMGAKVGETLRECDDTKYDAVKWSRIELFWDEHMDESKLEAIVLHEAGHALSLNHSSNPHDIMFPFTHPPYAAILSDRDRNSIKALYTRD